MILGIFLNGVMRSSFYAMFAFMSTTHNLEVPEPPFNLQGSEDSLEAQALTKRRGVITERGTTTIANRIAEVRKERGISQQAMAKKLGVTQPIISRYERGELRIHAELLAKIAKLLDTSSDELLGLTPVKRTQPKSDLDTADKRKLWKKFQQIAKWPEKDQRAVIRIINSMSK